MDTPFACVVAAAGSVESVTPAELRELGARVLLVRTYELVLRPGAEIVRDLGGLRRCLGWDGPLMTDSASFEVLSLGFEPKQGASKRAPRLVRLDDNGAQFTSPIDGSLQRLTPESAMAAQEALGADIILALDQPTSAAHDADYTRQAMERTHRWARRFVNARQRVDLAPYGVVQGGAFEALRNASAQFIGGLPFAGAAIGGSYGRSTAELLSVLDWSVPNLPPAWPRHLVGVGNLEDVFACVERGVDQFDSAAPTRLAHKGQLYTPAGQLDITGPEHMHDSRPIQRDCACYTCHTGFSRGYLRHLFSARELLGYTLGSLHNLQFVQQLMHQIRQAIRADQLEELRDSFLSRYAVGLTAG